MKQVILAGVLMIVAMLAGCKKEYELTFVNHKAEAVQVDLTTPEGPQSLGTLAPHDSVKTTLKLDEDELPADCTYTAGDEKKPFQLTKDMRTQQWIHIGTDQGPIDKKVKVIRKRETEVKDKPVDQGTVVE
jgi:hypothetical protein